MASGVGNTSFTYQWFLNGRVLEEDNKQILNILASLNATGSYTCSVKNQYGGIGQSEAVLTILSMLIKLLI